MKEEQRLEIKNIIKLLESKGIDVTDEKNRFNKLLSEKRTNNDGTAVLVKTESDKEVKELLTELNKYLPLLKFYQTIEYLELDNIELNERIKLSEELLTVIESQEERIITDEPLLKRAHQAIYKTIKQEIKLTFSSKILERATNNVLSNLYLTEIVHEDIEELKKSTYLSDPQDLKMLSEEEAKSNLAGPKNYISKMLLLKIVKCESKDKLKEISKELTQKINTTFESLTKRLSSDLKSITNFTSRIEDYVDNLEYLSDEINKRIVSAILTAAMLTGFAIGGPILLKKMLTKDYFETKKETIVMESELRDPVIDTYYTTKIKDKEKLLLDVYDEKRYGDRERSTYYLEKAIRETDYEYLTIDVTSGGVSQKTYYRSDNFETEDPNYDGEIRVLTKIYQGETPSYTNFYKGGYITLCVILYISIFASGFIPYFPINDIINLYKKLKENSETVYKYRKNYNHLSDLLRKSYKTIEKNEELMGIYNQILESKLLDSSMDEITSNIDKLIKEIESDKTQLLKYSENLSGLQKRYQKTR